MTYRETYTRVKHFEPPNIGTKIIILRYKIMYNIPGKVHETLGFVKEETGIGMWDHRTQVPLINGMKLKLLWVGSRLEHKFKNQSETPFTVFLTEKNMVEKLVNGIEVQIFDNTIKLSRLESIIRIKDGGEKYIYKHLNLEKDSLERLPSNSLFEIVGYNSAISQL